MIKKLLMNPYFILALFSYAVNMILVVCIYVNFKNHFEIVSLYFLAPLAFAVFVTSLIKTIKTIEF